MQALLRSAPAIALLYLIVPNLPVVLLRDPLGLSTHGFLNIECLVVGLVALCAPRIVVFLLLLAEICGAFVYLLCYTFQFSLRTLWAALPYLSKLPANRGTPGVTAAVLTVLAAAVLAWGVPRAQGRQRMKVVAWLLAFILLLFSLDIVDGHNPVWPRDDVSAIPRLAMSPVVAIAKREIFFRLMGSSSREAADAPMDSASASAVNFAGGGVQPDVVLILVESWGDLRDKGLARALVAPFQDPRVAAHYRITEGTAPFDGLTLPGEGRELCHSHIGFRIQSQISSIKDGCLPAQFHARGYRNIAVHGYMGQMFGRNDWYRQIGFDSTYFRPDFDRAGLPQCEGAFPGTCDASVAQWISGSLLAPPSSQPRFIYWVTLNSHLPVPVHPDLPGDGVCAAHPELAASVPFCSWFRLVSAVHSSAAEVALGKLSRPTVFILVGDHAPPFAQTDLRRRFSDADVPYIVLTPLDAKAPESPSPAGAAPAR